MNTNTAPNIQPGADDGHKRKKPKLPQMQIVKPVAPEGWAPDEDEEKYSDEYGEHPNEAKARGIRIGKFLEASLKSTSARVQEVMKPLKLDAADLVTKSGINILTQTLGKRPDMILESGGNKPSGVKTKFQGSDVYAFTSPGLQKKNRKFPENRDGFVISKTKDDKNLQIIMTHGVSEGPEAAALANTAAVSAGYDLNRMHPAQLPEVFENANDHINDIKVELDVPKQRLAILGATIHKQHPGRSLYAVDVMSAGDIHCFVVEPLNGKVEQKTPVATVAGELQKAELPMKERNELLDEDSKNSGVPVEKIKKILTMSAGLKSDLFKPFLTELSAAPGEIVVIATSDFMRSFGGEEFFQDGHFGKMISERLNGGKKLGEIIPEMMKSIMKRQKDAKLEDYPASIVALEIPGEKEKAVRKPEQSVESILDGDILPLKLDLENL